MNKLENLQDAWRRQFGHEMPERYKHLPLNLIERALRMVRCGDMPVFDVKDRAATSGEPESSMLDYDGHNNLT
jgi:hypothetical protein